MDLMAIDRLKKEWYKFFDEHDDIYIYGAAKGAKRMYHLAEVTQVENKIKGFLVTDGNNNPKEFLNMPVIDIHYFEKKDSGILCPHLGKDAQDICELLEKLGFKKYVLANVYMKILLEVEKININDIEMQKTLRQIEFIQKEKSELRKINDKKVVKQVLKKLANGKPDFGDGMPYQSLETIGLEGQRPTLYRTLKYHLREICTNEKTVLDIGCNTGFIDMTISPYVKYVTGVEYDKVLADIANEVKQYLKVENCSFINNSFQKWIEDNAKQKYDVIFSFAVHHWIGLEADEYVECLDKLLNVDGYICFESHIITDDDGYFKCIKCFEKRQYSIIRRENIMDDGIHKREFIIMRKNISEVD